MTKTAKIISLFFLVKCAISFMPASAEAINSPSKTITVSPSIAQLDLKTDKPIAEITYKNTTDTDIELSLSASDFRELTDGSRLQFLEKNDASNYKYSLASWITFENQTILLSPNESKKAKVFIDSSRLSPGGHYASIQAEISQNTGPEKITIKGILSSLLFVRASTGKEIEELSIEKLIKSEKSDIYPTEFAVTLKNSGNVEISPSGLLTVENPFGKQISKGYLNEGSQITLPETIRTFKIPITTNSSFFLPGKYTAKIVVSYGGNGTSIEKSITFFTLGSPAFIWTFILILSLLIGVGLIIFKKDSVLRVVNKVIKVRPIKA